MDMRADVLDLFHGVETISVIYKWMVPLSKAQSYITNWLRFDGKSNLIVKKVNEPQQYVRHICPGAGIFDFPAAA